MELTIYDIKTIGEAFPGSTGIYCVDGDKIKTMYASSDLPRILDMDADEYGNLTKQDAMNVILPVDRAYVFSEIQKCADGEKQELNLYYRVIHKKNVFDWVHLRAKVIGSHAGMAVFAASFTNATVETDIYQDLINHTSDMIYVCDCKTYEILYANEAARKYRQQGGGSLLGLPCYAYIHEKSAPCEDCFMKRMKSGENISLTRFNAIKNTWEHLHGEFIDWCGHQAFVQYIEDVTESETLHQALYKTENRLETAVDAAGLSVWEYDIKAHKIVSANSGFRANELPGTIENVPQSLLAYVLPADREKLLDLYRRADLGETPLSANLRFINPKSGGIACLRVIYTIAKDQTGEPVTAYGTGIDITDQFQARESYRNSIEALLASNPESLCAYLLNLSRNECSEGHGTSTYIARSLQSDTVDGVFANIIKIIPDSGERTAFGGVFERTRLIEQYQEGRTSGSMDYRRLDENGKIIWVRTFLNLLKNPDTNDITCFIYSLDITKQKEHDSILQILTGQEYQLLSVIDLDSGMAEAAFIGRGLPEIYRRFYRSPGDRCSAEEIRRYISKNWLLPADAQRYLDGTDIVNAAQVLSEKDHFEFTVRARASGDGQPPTFHRFQYYWLDETHKKIISVMADVTRSVQIHQEEVEKERALRKQANAANEAKTEFLSRMSHDMRTPLNVILGLTHLSLERQHSPQTTEELRKIDAVSRFLLGLISDVLDVSRVESGRMTLHPEPYEAQEFFAYIDAFAVPLCEQKDLKLVLDEQLLHEYVPLMDKLRTNQIFFNLISNAAKFTPEGGTVTVRLRERLLPGCRISLQAVISDTGVGMTKAFQEHLFEPFMQEQRDDTSLSRGTGLGLSIVKQIVDLMGGKIEVESAPGCGTSFTLTGEFDCVPADTEKTFGSDNAPQDYSRLKNSHVLLCEDHPMNQEITRALLEEKGIVVDLADNGEIGVQKFSRSAPGFYDLILMDIRMPVLDGIEATCQIRGLDRRDAKTVPIVALSADAFEENIQSARDAGMDGYLAKPIAPEKLYEVLQKAVCGKKEI